MKSTKPPEITIQAVCKDSSNFPPFLGVIHRHFQKSLPAVSEAREVTLIAPLDMLGFMIPQILLDRVESLEVIYSRKGVISANS